MKGHHKPHSEETKKKISIAMEGNKNSEKYELTLEAAIQLMEKAVELSEKDEKYHFISTLCKALGTNRACLYYLIHDKWKEELKSLSNQLYNNLESNLYEKACRKEISDKMATLGLRNFFGADWNVATDRKEVNTNTKTTIVWEENILLPEGKRLQYIDITPKPKELTEYQEVNANDDCEF